MSTGVILNEIKTKLGGSLCMAQNPSNAIEHLGHGNGTVTLWSPNCGSPLVKMLCHRGPLASIALDISGNYMATAGLDGQFKLWDLRTYTLLNSYYSKAAISSLSFSQKGLLAVTSGSNVAIWKDSYKTKQKSPYIAHMIPGGQMNDSQFCPYDDTLGLGHSLGISSILVPGAGEPNFDSLESNPFETKKQRREAEVRHILTKIQPEMIALDTELIGKIKEDHSIVLEWNRQLGREANATTSEEAAGGKQRSRSSTLRRYLKKGANIVDPKKEAMVQKIQKEKDRKASLRTRQHVKNWSSLNRFEKKDV